MVRDLAGSNRLTLGVNRRSDEVLFDFYTAITGTRPIAEAVQEARILFPRTERAADTTLVISHSTRRYINTQRNLAEKPHDAIFFKAPSGKLGGTAPQSMYIWRGIRLIGAGGLVKKGIKPFDRRDCPSPSPTSRPKD